MEHIEVLRQELQTALANDARFQFKHRARFFQEGICPACGKKELYCLFDYPFRLTCNRLNKCGYVGKTKDFFPHLLENLRRKAPPTPENPHATADLFLTTRGFSRDRWRGCYTQDRRHSKEDGHEGYYDTIAFTLTGGQRWHRLIDYHGKNKGYFDGAYKGQVWMPPQMEIHGRILLTEGVFETMAWVEAGIKSVSLLSCSHQPWEWLEQYLHHDIEWVVAFNNDEAGIKKAKVLVAEMQKRGFKKVLLALPPLHVDWNDLFLEGRFDPVENLLTGALYRGRLIGALDAMNYYDVHLERHNTPLIFDWNKETWTGYPPEGEKSPKPKVRRVADATIHIAYTLRKELSAKKSINSDQFDVVSDRETQRILLNAEEITNNANFKTALYRYGHIHWTGTQSDLTLLVQREFEREKKVVRQIEIVGYDPESDVYVFADSAYQPHGRRVLINEDGYFPVNGKGIVSTYEEPYFLFEETHNPDLWYDLFKQAYSFRGLTAFGFYTASLFAEQMSKRITFFPFLSLHGDPGTGKSWLWSFLNTAYARDIAEGIPPSKVNTAKGEVRKIAQMSNLPVALLENNDGSYQNFDYQLLLTLYNRGHLQVRAKKTNDNQTEELTFKATLAFIWNREQLQTRAQKERVISVEFTEEDLNSQTFEAYEKLNELKLSQVSKIAGLRHAVLTSRVPIWESLMTNWKWCTDKLRKKIKTTRIADVHAVAYAGWAAFAQVLLPEAFVADRDVFYDYIEALAIHKEKNVENDSDFLSHFFECLDQVLSNNENLNYSGDTSLIAINLPEMQKAFESAGFRGLFNDIGQLREQLKKSNRFVKIQPGYSKRDRSSIKCWFFKNLDKKA